MKIIKTILKYIAILIGIVVGVPLVMLIGYVLYNTPFSSPYPDLTADELNPYVSYLNEHGQDPMKYVGAKFDTHDVVIIGEQHRTAEDSSFIASLVPYLYREHGVRRLCIEFGSHSHQGLADRVLTAPEFDRAAVISMMREWFYSWNYEEYLSIYQAVWELNCTIPDDGEKFRLILLNTNFSEFKKKLVNQEPIEHKNDVFGDGSMWYVFKKEILDRNLKSLVFCGLHHAFTRFHQPKFLFLEKFTPPADRLGNLIYKTAGDRVFMINLHAPFFNRFGLFAFHPIMMKVYYPFGGVLDRAFEQVKQPVGFDVPGSPFGGLKDKWSYYSLDRGSILWKDFCDGWVMLDSLDRLHRVKPINDWVASDKAWQNIMDQYRDMGKTGPESRERFINMLNRDGLDIERMCKSRLVKPRFWETHHSSFP